MLSLGVVVGQLGLERDDPHGLEARRRVRHLDGLRARGLARGLAIEGLDLAAQNIATLQIGREHAIPARQVAVDLPLNPGGVRVPVHIGVALVGARDLISGLHLFGIEGDARDLRRRVLHRELGADLLAGLLAVMGLDDAGDDIPRADLGVEHLALADDLTVDAPANLRGVSVPIEVTKTRVDALEQVAKAGLSRPNGDHIHDGRRVVDHGLRPHGLSVDLTAFHSLRLRA